jgi:glycosyltransferase involved in cell wall biosynthesis
VKDIAISVVIPARDAEATIGATLAALAEQELEVAYEVIVVDSGSTDETAAIARAAGVVTDVLSNPRGEPAGSRNLGVARATAPKIAFTDADCVPEHGWLAAGLRALEHADVVQGRVRPVHQPGPFDRTVSVASEYGLYETANLFVHREVFDRVGGFEPVISTPGVRPWGEDTWFVWRARRAGARTAFAAEAVVAHAVVPRGAAPFVAECWRRRRFPALVARVPELREAFLHRRWFLSAGSYRFDLALVGLLSGRLVRRPALAALATAAYLAPVVRRARWAPRGHRLRTGAAWVAADAVTFAALIAGSVEARTPVL